MIELEFYIPDAPDNVWEHLTQTEHMRQWWTPEIYLEPHFHGKFVERWTDANGDEQVVQGTVTAIEPVKRLQMDWQENSWPQPTRVEFLLKLTQEGTTLYIQHSGWGAFDNKTRQKIVDAHTEGWTVLMEKFMKYCSGIKR